MKKDWKLYFYLAIVYSLFALCLWYAFNNYPFDISISTFLLFVLISTVTESLLIIYKNNGYSPGFVITIASIILFGPLPAVLIVSMGMMFRLLKQQNKIKHIFNVPFYKTLFNGSVMGIATFTAAETYQYISLLNLDTLTKMTLGAIGIVIAFSFINNFFMTILISILSKLSFGEVFKSNLGFLLIGVFFTAPIGIFLVYMYNHFAIGGILIILLPVLFVRYTYNLYVESKNKYHEMVKVLMNALEIRDKYTEGHCRNVAKIVKKISEELKYSDRKIEELELAAYLHDIGKIGVPDHILNKPGKLTEEEYKTIQQHPVIGYDIVKGIYGIEKIVDLVRHHHERYDGTGYPDGKKGDELDLDVYILQLADSVDAMSTDRVYRKALNEEEIKEELINNKGKQFHPKVVDLYLKILEKEKKGK